MSDIFKPVSLTVKQFLAPEDASGDVRRKVIPRFQRGYSWGAGEVRNFLADTESARTRKSKTYFIGAVLCIDKTDNTAEETHYHEIVDGQQRLTTLSLIFAAVMHYVKDNESPELQKQLGISPSRFMEKLSSFLYYGGGLFDDDVTLSERPCRLEPSDFDRMAYQRVIRDGPSKQNGGANKQFNDVYNVIKGFIDEQVKDSGSGVKWLKEYADFLATKVLLVGIFIAKEVDAYEVFEVLNDRNMRLAAVDLIKNKLLSCLGQETVGLNAACDQWDETFTAVCGGSSARKQKTARMQEYIRCYVQMKAGEKIDPKGLYRHLRDAVVGDVYSRRKQNAKDFLNEINTHCHKFNAICSKNDSFWERNRFNQEITDHVGYLKDYRVCSTLMFSLLYARKPVDFVLDAYRVLAVFMKRTRAVRERFSVMERYEEGFAQLAYQLKERKGPKNIHAFYEEIVHIDKHGWKVIPDESFIAQLSARTSFKSDDAKEMLTALANYEHRRTRQTTVVDREKVTLEHILPQNPNIKEWPSFQDDVMASAYAGWLGNLTLLDGKQNAGASNRKFDDKKRLFYAVGKCGVSLTNELCKYDAWTPEAIKERSEKLAKLAAKVWAFDEA